MVCNRCVIAVRQQLEHCAIEFESVDLGEVVLASAIAETQMTTFREKMNAIGFEVLDDHKSSVVAKVKSTIIKVIHQNEVVEANKKLSVLLSEQVGLDYNFLSSLFSSVEGVTIEKYAISQRIERAKELMVYNQMNINEIAFELGYSSVQHLSQQFKKVTGLTPTEFKQLDRPARKPLDHL